MRLRRAWKRLGRSMILCALLLAALPSGAFAFEKAVWGEPYLNGVNQFPLYQRLGVTLDEVAIKWNEVASTRPANPTDPNDPAYQWPATIDQAVALAQQYHIKIMIQLLFAPGWANGHKPPNWAPRKPQDFADFATAAAREYPSVHLWMIWGEANRTATFMPLSTVPCCRRLTRREQLGPHTYARILDAAYGALKNVDPQNTVIGGATFTHGDILPKQWIMNLRLPNGKAPRMDIYAHNPFGWRPPAFSNHPTGNGQIMYADLHRLAWLIDRYLHRGMPIFLSEWAIPTAPDDEFYFWVDPPVAAQWITTAFSESRRWKRIYGLGWVHVYDNPPTSMAGLLTAQGRKKPLYWAFLHG